MEELEKEKINKLELTMIELSKRQQGYDLPDPKDYLIFRIINKKIEYFLELGHGYTINLNEAGKFNETGINHFNAYIVNSFDEAFNNNYDYYAINILKSN